MIQQAHHRPVRHGWLISQLWLKSTAIIGASHRRTALLGEFRIRCFVEAKLSFFSSYSSGTTSLRWFRNSRRDFLPESELWILYAWSFSLHHSLASSNINGIALFLRPVDAYFVSNITMIRLQNGSWLGCCLLEFPAKTVYLTFPLWTCVSTGVGTSQIPCWPGYTVS